METFQYTITDEIGIHARPAGELAKLAKEFQAVRKICEKNRGCQRWNFIFNFLNICLQKLIPGPYMIPIVHKSLKAIS